MEASNSSTSPSGSIINTTQRLQLWAGRSGGSLAQVEYSSEFARQRVVERLRTALAEQGIAFRELVLPTYQPATAIVKYLLESLHQCESGVVSITGFATAFSNETPLDEALRIVNFNREKLANFPLRQIWWITPVFLQTAIHAMPDLSQWFSLRLHLTEAVIGQPSGLMTDTTGSTANIDDAQDRSRYLIQQFERARATEAPPEDLLTTYLLPALEALAEVGAQKDLHDLTSQFEGFLGQLKTTNSPELAASLDRLASLYADQGRYSQAEPLYRRALHIRERQLGSEHPSVATSLNNLAGLYRSQGRYSEAEPLYLRSLDIRERQLGREHPDVAFSLNNLAALYDSQGRYSEAEPRYLRSLDIWERQLGADHPDVALSLNNLAALYDSQGRYSEAEPLLLRSLDIRERQLGREHPNVATSLNNLAGLYYSQGRYSEAESLYLRSLDIWERQLGSEHPDVATRLNNLALLYDSQGRYSEAESLYLRSLDIRERHLGSEHPDVAFSLNNLALLYDSQGRYSEAEPLLLRSLDIRERQLGSEHPLVATSLSNLAGLYDSQGRYSEAEPLYVRALAILFEKLGDTHPKTQTTLENFRLLLQEAIAAGETAQLSNHPLTQKLLKEIENLGEGEG